MKKSLIAIFLLYLSTFLFFKEEIHQFSHGNEETSKERSLGDTCQFKFLFTYMQGVTWIPFSTLAPPEFIKIALDLPIKSEVFEKFFLFLPPSRAPPKFS